MFCEYVKNDLPRSALHVCWSRFMPRSWQFTGMERKAYCKIASETAGKWADSRFPGRENTQTHTRRSRQSDRQTFRWQHSYTSVYNMRICMIFLCRSDYFSDAGTCAQKWTNLFLCSNRPRLQMFPTDDSEYLRPSITAWPCVVFHKILVLNYENNFQEVGKFWLSSTWKL
jgi:hypothetical protein